MPKRSLRLCAHPGCSELVPFGRCEKHKRVNEPKRDLERQKLYGRRWRKIRASHLAGSPWCVSCLADGYHIPATEVDHIIRHEGNENLFFDVDNLQSLCKRCHSSKTAKEVGFRRT